MWMSNHSWLVCWLMVPLKSSHLHQHHHQDAMCSLRNQQTHHPLSHLSLCGPQCVSPCECVCVCLHIQKEGGRESEHLCVSICVWVAANALGVLLGAQMVPRPATAAPDDGHILTWDPQLSGSHTSCSGLSRQPSFLFPRPGAGPAARFATLKKPKTNTAHGEVGGRTLPAVFHSHASESQNDVSDANVRRVRALSNAELLGLNDQSQHLPLSRFRVLYLTLSSFLSLKCFFFVLSFPSGRLICPHPSLCCRCPPWLAVHLREASFGSWQSD